MKKISKKIIAILLIAALTIQSTILATADADSVSKLGAMLDSYEEQEGSFTLSASSRIFVVSETEPIGTGELMQTVQLVQRQFAADQKPTANVLEIVWGPVSWAKDGDIVMNLETGLNMANEAYSLDVAGKAIVTAKDVDGLLYGANMLLKFLRAAGSNTLSGLKAADAPDTKERTVMLDCARKYYTKEWICNFIKEISWMGYNAIELHFSEDGGFRMDFWDPTYYTANYSPQNDFSWICGSYVQSWVNSGYKNDPDAGKYLTTAEIVEILRTAKEYHIDVIPSFDSPAHMDYITWKFEQNYISNKNYSFTYNGKTYKAADVNGCINYAGLTGSGYPEWCEYTTINILDETATAFIFQIYADIADFFKAYAGSTDFAIGADEVNLTASSAIKWNYDDFPDYINKLDNLLNSKGYTTRIFNDFIGTTSYTTTKSFNEDIEILYWISPFNPNSGAANSDATQPVSYFVNEGRTLYNAIQTNCYYVLRVADGLSSTNKNYMKDARNPENTNWTFYHSTEEDIYNEWYPADISEHGNYSENVADVPESQLGGGYFLIWNDYAALNTEAEVWNDVKDNTGTSSYTYSLRDRMWSNITKMWNSDVNSSVNFSTFETIRDKYGDFPGLTSCSSPASLPGATAVTQAYCADHTELTNALANKLSQGLYSDESYVAYEAAYAKAEQVNASHAATAEELAAQVAALKAAEAALEIAETAVTITCKTTVGGIEKTIRTLGVNIDTKTFKMYLEPMRGYEFKSVDGATFEPLPSGDGSGYIYGNLNKSSNITVWYENVPNTSRLNEVISYAVTEQGTYAETSWSEYIAALNNANEFTIVDTTTQADIDDMVAKLTVAQTKLVVPLGEGETTDIISIEKVTEKARLGKRVGLKITTTPDVASLTVKNEDGNTEELTLCVAKVSTTEADEKVKVWLVNFPADEAGTEEYTVHVGSVSESISITVQ